MFRKLTWWTLLTLAGCGGADVGVSVNLTLERSIYGDNDLLTIYALGPEYAKSTISCSQPPAAPIDRQAEMVLDSIPLVLGGVNPLTGTKQFKLDEIEAGTNRMFLADVVDDVTATVRHGIGCVAGVTIEKDKDTPVALTIVSCPGVPGC
jgi:hypothetical protein